LRRAGPVLLLVLLSQMIPTSALAQWAEMEQAVTAFNAGEFQRSLKLLKQVAPSVRDPKELGRLHLYVGLNHAFLGQKAKARAAFAAALTHNPELEVDPKRIRPDVVQLFISVHATLKGALEVGGPQGAAVRVDGAGQGEPPVRLDLVVGRHHVEVRDAAGRSLFRDWVVIRRGKTTPVKTEVAATGGAAEYRPPPATVGPVARPPLVEPPPQVDGRVEPGSRIWTWVAGGTSLVFAGIGVGLVLSGESDYDEYKTTPDADRMLELEESIPRKYYAAYAMFGLGAALAATAAVLYFYEGREAAPSGRVRLHIGGAGVGFSF